MADEATQAVEETQEAIAETPATDSQPAEQTTEVTPASETPASTGENNTSKTQDVKIEYKPTSRRSAAYRIQELVRENNALKQQVIPKTETVDEWGNPEPAGDPPDPKYAKLEAEIEQLKGMVKPVMTNTQKAADDTELSELFTGKADERAKYEEPMRKLWELPQYKDLAAQDLYKIATYDEAIAQAKTQAIEEYKKAEKEAKESSASGSSATNRTGKTEKTAWDMTDEEFKAATDKARASG